MNAKKNMTPEEELVKVLEEYINKYPDVYWFKLFKESRTYSNSEGTAPCSTDFAFLRDHLPRLTFFESNQPPTELAKTCKKEGDKYFENKEYLLADILFAQALGLGCQDKELVAELYNKRALAMLHLQHCRFALEYSEKALEIKPDYLEPMHTARMCSYCLQDYDKCMSYCDQILKIGAEKNEIDKYNVSAIKNLCAILKCVKSKKPSQKLANMHEKEDRNRQYQNQKKASADASFAKSTTIQCSEECKTANELALLYKEDGNTSFKKKNYLDADYHFGKGIATKCDDKELLAQLYNNRALAQFKLENYETSLDCCKLALEIKPDYLKPMRTAAKCCYHVNDYPECIRYCSHILKINVESNSKVDKEIVSLLRQVSSMSENCCTCCK